MGDLISRIALLKSIREVSTSPLNEWDTMGVLNIVNKQPAVEAVPVVHGEWIKTDKGIFHNVNTRKVERQFSYECPLCGYHTGNQGKYFNFCPNCGSDMRKKV